MIPIRPGLRPLVACGLTTLLTLAGLAASYVLQRMFGVPGILLMVPVVTLAGARWGPVPGLYAVALSAAGLGLATALAGPLAIDGSGTIPWTLAFVAAAALSVLIASRQHRLAQQLRIHEADLRAIFDLAAVGTGMVDPSTGRFVRVNERLCAMTGFTREELLSKTVAEITHPDDRERDREFIHALKSGRLERWSTEKRYLHRSGDPVWVLVNGTIVRGLDGDSDHLIAHAADIADRRRADDALREASRLKDEFLATLSHELRTPLNVVVGWTHILTRETNCPTPVRRSLAVIARNAEALRRLTDDLIGLSSVLTGRVRLEDQRVDLHAVIDDAVDSVSLAAHAKGLSILKETGGHAIVRGDEARLRQVFWNLLSNAVKFTSTGGTITVTSQPDGDQIAVRVSDTGIGIPESFLPYVFDKFRQEDASHTRRHQGLGLGLAIARQFTELHGGTIAVQSPGRNQGTIFTVTLPVADGPAAPAFEPGAPGRYGFARRATSHADPIEAEASARGEVADEVTDDERLHDEGVADEVTTKHTRATKW